MKNLLITILGILIFIHVVAQDENLYNHYFINQALVNPAYNGFNGKHGLQLNTRTDWTGFDGAPSVYAINYNGPVSQNIGLGASMMTEKVASFNRYRVGLNYSFRFDQGDLRAALGLNTNFEYYRVQDHSLDNTLYENNDRVLSEYADGQSFFDAGLGVYLAYQNYYVGLTSPNLIQSRLDDVSLDGDEDSVFRYYTALFGALYEFGSTGVSLEPSVYFRKARNIPMNFSGTLLIGYLEEKIKAGFSYHSAVEGSASFIVGSKIENLHIFYSYNLNFSPLQQYGSGNHEITVGITFDSRRSRFRNAY